MKRRNVLLAGSAILAAPAIGKFECAFAAGAPDATRLTKDLTPLGAERAASSSGLVPAWTGGASTPLAGWTPGAPVPDAFADEKPVFSVTAENMSKYSDMLSDGQKQMFKHFPEYQIDVYPTHRTACAPQYVYDNTAQNVSRTQIAAGGITHGITNCFAGPPFPILSDDPATAGAQVIWNHLLRWNGAFSYSIQSVYVVGDGGVSLTSGFNYFGRALYYNPDLTVDTFNGNITNYYIEYLAPPNLLGGKFQTNANIQPLTHPNSAFEYLVGEGRIREAPQTEYDTPNTTYGDSNNYDEAFLFFGAMDRYTWKLVGKKEMIVPYNQSAIFRALPKAFLGAKLADPSLVRHEVHRCWVVEATLAPGKRMSDPFRRFYVDEDTWTALQSDLYDRQGNYWRYGINMMESHPELPGTVFIGSIFYNLQSQEYIVAMPFYDGPAPLACGNTTFQRQPASLFSPESMANSGGL